MAWFVEFCSVRSVKHWKLPSMISAIACTCAGIVMCFLPDVCQAQQGCYWGCPHYVVYRTEPSSDKRDLESEQIQESLEEISKKLSAWSSDPSIQGVSTYVIQNAMTELDPNANAGGGGGEIAPIVDAIESLAEKLPIHHSCHPSVVTGIKANRQELETLQQQVSAIQSTLHQIEIDLQERQKKHAELAVLLQNMKPSLEEAVNLLGPVSDIDDRTEQLLSSAKKLQVENEKLFKEKAQFELETHKLKYELTHWDYIDYFSAQKIWASVIAVTITVLALAISCWALWNVLSNLRRKNIKTKTSISSRNALGRT